MEERRASMLREHDIEIKNHVEIMRGEINNLNKKIDATSTDTKMILFLLQGDIKDPKSRGLIQQCSTHESWISGKQKIESIFVNAIFTAVTVAAVGFIIWRLTGYQPK